MSFAPIDTSLRPGDATPWETFVPTFYRPHGDLTVTVTKGGESLGFTVGEVAADRRWAIGPDGEVLDQMTFQEKLVLVWDEQYRMRNATPMPHLGNPIPRVESYVAWGPDPMREGKLRLLSRPRLVTTATARDDTPIVDTKALAASGFRPVPTETPEPPPAAAAPVKERKGMSEEARRAASERMKARHAAKQAEKLAAPAAE